MTFWVEILVLHISSAFKNKKMFEEHFLSLLWSGWFPVELWIQMPTIAPSLWHRLHTISAWHQAQSTLPNWKFASSRIVVDIWELVKLAFLHTWAWQALPLVEIVFNQGIINYYFFPSKYLIYIWVNSPWNLKGNRSFNGNFVEIINLKILVQFELR